MQRKLDRIGQFSRTALLAASVLPLTFASLPASAADYLTSAPTSVGDAGLCSQQGVLRSVVADFGYQVRNVPNLPQVGISAMSDVRLTRYEPKTIRLKSNGLIVRPLLFSATVSIVRFGTW